VGAKKFFALQCVILFIALISSKVNSDPIADSFQYPLPNWAYYTANGFGFGRPNPNYKGYHLGIDTNVDGTPTGIPVFAIANGLVVISDNIKIGGYGSDNKKLSEICGVQYYGYAIVIQHQLPDGSFITSLYGHLQPGSDKYNETQQVGIVPKGYEVKKGQYIGRVADFWHFTGKNCERENWHHLHFGIRKGKYYTGNDSEYVKGYDNYGWTENYTRHKDWENPKVFLKLAITPTSHLSSALIDAYNRSGGVSVFGGQLPQNYTTPSGVASTNIPYKAVELPRGGIYESSIGVFVVYGAIYQKYHAIGGPRHYLGLPISNEEDAPRSSFGTTGRISRFERGSIVWLKEKDQTFVVQGAIFKKWASLGYSGGQLGFPTSDEYPYPGGARSDFEGGYITWTSQTGAQVVLKGSSVPISARIDNYSASPPKIQVGQTTTFKVTFTNTGNTQWTFGAGISLRRPDGVRIDNLPNQPVKLNPNQQGIATWTYTIDREGSWEVVFGIWKDPAGKELLTQTGWIKGVVIAQAIPSKPAPTNLPPQARITLRSGSSTIYENQVLQVTIPPGKTAQVIFSGERSADPEGSPLTYQWFINGQMVNKARDFSFNLGRGSHQILLKVRDNQGLENAVGATVNIIEQGMVTPKPEITSNLRILETPPYKVGQIITAEFSIRNSGNSPITFDVLTVGGRLNGQCPNNRCPDFEFRPNVTLPPNGSYTYQGRLKIEAPGNYHFFTAYRTKEGQWNTAIPTLPGVRNTLDISVTPPSVTVPPPQPTTPIQPPQPYVTPSITARIDMADIIPRSVQTGGMVTLRLRFTNTGNINHTFIAGASLWRPGDYSNPIANFERPVTLSSGQSTEVTWSYQPNLTGNWGYQFAVWKEKPFVSSNLLIKQPSPIGFFSVTVPSQAPAPMPTPTPAPPPTPAPAPSPQVVSGRIDSYSPGDPNNPVRVKIGNSVPLIVRFTNIGNTTWRFIVGASVWDSKGNIVGNYSTSLSSPLQPGQQTSVSWNHQVRNAGDYWAQFGLWKATSFVKENLLDKKPSPAQRLISAP
jgi:hypothetical protein